VRTIVTATIDNADKFPHFRRMLNLREQIIVVSDAYGRLAKQGRKRISTIVLNRGSKLDDIAQGGDLNTATFERAMLWFSENWPKGEEWPSTVPRPSVSLEQFRAAYVGEAAE